MKKDENLKITDYCEKQEQNSLPFIRGGIGRGDDSFETLKIEGFQKKNSLHLIPDPSPERGEGRKRAAFTLAETLITLTILGVVAAITVPMLINKQMESANRTKLKKAMAAYEKALNQMIIDYDIKGVITATEGFGIGECDISSKYFKAVEILNANNCRFKTADKVWWDITDIEHPVISLKDQLTDAMVTGVKANSDDYKDDKTLFSMTGEITNGIVRINDQADTGLTDDAKANLDKIYAFMNKDGSGSTTTGGGGTPVVEDTPTGIFGSPYQSLDDFPQCEGVIENDLSTMFNSSTNCYFNYSEMGKAYKFSSNEDIFILDDNSSFHVFNKAHGGGVAPDYMLSNCESFSQNCSTCEAVMSSCPAPDANGKYSYVP